jgi:hypothetical protein
LTAAIVLLFAAVNVFAQFETADVLGSVRDPNESAVAGVNVVLKNVATGIEQIATTDASGDYQFTNVKIGAEARDSSIVRRANLAGIQKICRQIAGCPSRRKQRRHREKHRAVRFPARSLQSELSAG